MAFQDSFEMRVRPAADRAFGVSVTLTQGAGTTLAFTAEWEHQLYEVVSAEGFETKLHGRDFMFAVSDVVIASSTVEPRKGDVIDITENGVAKQFLILSLEDRPAVELMAGGSRWRVHTKQVA